MKLQSLRLGLRLSKASVLFVLIAIAIAGYLLASPQSAATMATLNVNSTADTVDVSPGDGVCLDLSGNCSVRAAVMEANALAGPDTITIPAGTYTLTRAPFDDEFNFDGANESTGDIDILNDAVTIIGAGAASTIIDGGNIDRIFDINSGFTFSPGTPGNVTIEGVTLRAGNSPTDSFGFFHSGGAIQIDGLDWNTFVPANISLTVVDSVIMNNKAAGAGGGIASFNAASVIIEGTSFSGNESTNSQGGGLFYDGAGDPGVRTLTITNSTFSGNKALNGTFGSGGGVWTGGSATVDINNSTFSGNQAGANGGGIFADAFLASNSKTFEKNRFLGNTSKQGGATFNRSGTAVYRLNVVVGNTASVDPTSTGFHQAAGAPGSTATLVNNWWGCNQGPTVSPCDRVSGTISGPWLVLSHTATPNSVLTGGTSSLQADFFTPSSGSPLTAVDLVALEGRAITFDNAVLGTISGADTQISGGKANATYTAGPVGGNGSADATVDSATVTASISIQQAPEVTTNPADQTVCEGSTATFTAASSGFPTPTVQWQVSTDNGGSFNDIPGATNTTLSFTATAAQNGNQYRAVFTNAGGTDTTTAATLTVNTTPVVTDNPDNVAVCDGAIASFTATANGSPAPTVQWQVSTGGPFTNIPGETNNTLSFTANAGQNGNSYRAVFTNECGTTNSTAATLTINANTAATTPADQTVCQGTNATFSTTASGTGPFTYQWKLDGSNIAGATNSSVVIPTGSLSPGNHTVEVVVSGSCGTVTRSATLTVNKSPVITLNPVSQTISSGNVTFTAAANGTPAPTVQWQVSTNGGASFSDIPGATSTSLTFATNPSQNGNQYRAVFTNECGTAITTAATLTTCTPADVTGSPASVVDACVGTVVNFSASASGFPTPTVQWQVSTNGGVTFTNIPGATSTTLSVTASVAVRNNQYRAVFTNDCGTDTTAAATLGVDTIAPVITLNGNSISLWPPNHNYHTINVSSLVTSVSDSCSSNLINSVVITSVSSDETENGNGDGNTNNDIVIAANCKSVQLRSERQGGGNGRVYRINLKVTDSGGNVATATAKVSVPKNQNGSSAIDDGPAAGYTVTSSCP